MISEAKIDRALELMRRGPANADYFFSKLNSPDWIEPLAARGVFKTPFAARRSGDGYVFPVWTPGEYLARVAHLPAAHAQVVEILGALERSDNPRAYEAVADAALAMPTESAVRLVPKVVEGLRLQFQLLLPEKAVELLVRLNEAGEVSEAARLAKAAFELLPAPDSDDGDEVATPRLGRSARGRIDAWQYGRNLERCIPAVARPDGMRFLRVFCGLLTFAVKEGRFHEEEGREDYSYIWRHAIAHPQRHGGDFRDHLVSAVRDLAMGILGAEPTALSQVAEVLTGRESRVFDRLVLYLLRHFGEHDPALVEAWFDGPGTWTTEGLQPEFAELLEARFGQLSVPSRERYLAWIDAGPDMEGYADFFRSMRGTDPTTEDLRNRLEVWTRDRLAPIKAWISPDRVVQIEALVQEHGPFTPVQRGVSAVARGELRPLSDEEALPWDWQALAEMARTWTPPAEFDGPSRAGLEGSLRTRVMANPGEAIQHLPLLIDLDTAYVAAVLQALRDAVKSAQDDSIDWSSLLDFLVQLSDGISEREEPAEGPRWLMKCVVSLIGEGLDSSEHQIPLELQPQLWQVLERATEDPDPTPEHEERYGGRNMDPSTLSLNTVRGDAFHQVVRYALWWRRHVEKLADAEERLEAGLDALPEVRAALERHLDPSVDPSPAVRSVYGQWFPWLQMLDRNWAESHVDQVFPEDPDSEALFSAAWGAYVVYTQAYTDVLEVLRPKYRHAISSLAVAEREVGMGERPAEHLATHLMSYYWRGELALAPGDIVAEFFAVADSSLRGHALESLGRGLRAVEDPVPEDVLERLRDLWEWRASAEDAGEELRAFGWWVGAGRLDTSWSIQQLERILDRGLLPDPDHLVLEQLASLASTDAAAAVRPLERLVELAAEGWAIHGWLNELRLILEAGLKAPDGEARETAIRIVHRLGSMQFQAFRELLKEISTAEGA